MQFTFQETSPSLVVDLVNKFLSRLLSNDPNSSMYLKHWNSFRDLLSAAPFDLNPVFSYIHNLHSQPSQSGEHSASYPLPMPSELNISSRGQSCEDSADEVKRNTFNNLKVDVSSGHKRVTSNNFSFPQLSSTGMHVKNVTSINHFLPSPFKPSIDNIDSHGHQRHSVPTSVGQIGGGGSLAALDFDRIPSANHNFKEESGLNYLRNEGHSLTFLAELARKMKTKINRHNENLAQRHMVIPEGTPSPDSRTPLKDLRVYKSKNNPINGLNIYGAVKTEQEVKSEPVTLNVEEENTKKLISNVQKLPLY